MVVSIEQHSRAMLFDAAGKFCPLLIVNDPREVNRFHRECRWRSALELEYARASTVVKRKLLGSASLIPKSGIA